MMTVVINLPNSLNTLRPYHSPMTTVEIPEGSGNKYRYEYEGGSTVYKGPVGEAPELSEEEFLKGMIGDDIKGIDVLDVQLRQTYRKLSNAQKEGVLMLSTLHPNAPIHTIGTTDQQLFNVRTLAVLYRHGLVDWESDEGRFPHGGERYWVWQGGLTEKGKRMNVLIRELEPDLKPRSLTRRRIDKKR